MKQLELVQQTLQIENVPELKLKQFFVPDFLNPEFHEFLKSTFQNYEIIVAHDGIAKKCPVSFKLQKNSGITGNEIAEFLLNLGLKAQSWNVAHELNCNQELHASAKHIPKLSETLEKKFDSKSPKALFVFGSGTVTDLCKHSVFELNKNRSSHSAIELVCLPTAITVTAYTSHFSVLDYNGAKRTKPSLMPSFVFWVQDVIQCAPKQLTLAGYGDLLARFVAYGDWYLAFEFGVASRYDELAFRLMEPFAEFLKLAAQEFKNDFLSSEASFLMCQSLSMAGIAMSVSGETTPLSGFEHTISHGLDFLNLQNASAMPLHGEQVALGTLVSARCFHEFIVSPSPLLREFVYLTEERLTKILQKIIQQGLELSKTFTPELALKQFDELWPEYLKKHLLWVSQKEKREDLLERLPKIKRNLGRIVISPQELELIFQTCGFPFTPEELSPPQSADKFRWAIRFSPFVRSRASLADILFWLNSDPALVAAV
jgi:glycerol-1-phosphate dehydrogenase [NAD(P)+]